MHCKTPDAALSRTQLRLNQPTRRQVLALKRSDGIELHQAVARAQQYIVQGRGWVVDLDLGKFFDQVNHDKLMGQIAIRVEDRRLLKFIRAFLNAGVLENGLVSPSVEGTPQGGPLSPLLSNLVLDQLDRELERRDIALFATRMTVISTFAANVRVNE